MQLREINDLVGHKISSTLLPKTWRICSIWALQKKKAVEMTAIQCAVSASKCIIELGPITVYNSMIRSGIKKLIQSTAFHFECGLR